MVKIVRVLVATCGACPLQPLDRRRLDDTTKRSAVLACKLYDGSITHDVFDQLQLFCHTLATGDAQTALNTHLLLTTTHWPGNGHWLTGLQRLMELVAKLGVTL